MISKIKPLIFILICLFALNGCSKDIENIENKFTLDDVLRALESQELDLVSFGITGYPLKLNNVVPECILLKCPWKKNPIALSLYIFIFSILKRIASTGQKNSIDTWKAPNSQHSLFYMRKEMFLAFTGAKPKIILCSLNQSKLRSSN